MAGPDKLEGLPQQPPKIASSKTSPLGSQIPKETPGSPPTKDQVDLSPENTEYNQLLKRIDEMPDIRHDRIEHIRKSLEAGTYDIDSHLVAERIIQEIVHENAPPKTQPDSPDSSKNS